MPTDARDEQAVSHPLKAGVQAAEWVAFWLMPRLVVIGIVFWWVAYMALRWL